YVLQVHGFHCDMTEKVIRFDIVVDFAAPDTEEVHRKVADEVKNICPDYTVTVQIDSDFSD
ncbi:MAG: hypothetical protein IJG37_09080, partial [Synergistaceae bacterium]|nr:hypothetical protein [Synergistaceae bacterium]